MRNEDVMDARDVLESIDPTKLTDMQHLALALYFIGDVVDAAIFATYGDGDGDDDRDSRSSSSVGNR